MIRDITGTKLTPGNMGSDCFGNGRHLDKKGGRIECCCDKCGYYLCCIEEHKAEDCLCCEVFFCPRCKGRVDAFFRFLRLWKR